ncbi:DUF58 domain-containing protein [Pseudoxanthomonas sp. CAU 1598]|uniref:DUF58 domain-containing protein n=2 Tax=Pseudomarimonas arenosa TaxID=2774145 RepID=A0AAW3ZLE8_9GAMM|nr:DUF58 domain-containing protein [Pseudomarimonas arenosa]MBD8525502.1 DUF58 domain-containing protein [Pseudomarimonas arenosa]
MPMQAWWVCAAGLVSMLLIDAWRLKRTPSPELERELSPVVPVGVRRAVRLDLANLSRLPLELDVHDGHPASWAILGLPRRLQLAPGGRAGFEYELLPAARGEYQFSACQLRLRSPWALWSQQRQLDLPHRLRVFPNFAPLASLALVGADQASRTIGAHLQRRRGEGTEFHQLREYRIGDSMRQIDWKASQRARRLISREYQDERNQQVLIVLDCGRRMLAEDEGLSHFDHSLNAALMVAYIALRQGDAVGVLTADETPRFMPPQRGLHTIDRMLDHLFDVHAKPIATDFIDAATQLAIRQPRRALVLFITNARDEDCDELAVAARQMQRRHLVCIASLRELVLDEAMKQPVKDLDSALRHAATLQYLGERDQAHRRLRSQGLTVLDVTARQLPQALVEHYLAVKRAARL